MVGLSFTVAFNYGQQVGNMLLFAAFSGNKKMLLH